ncbi:hypothetical protein MAPG_00157 [Magnaporthiopsis poae ATCC 64411]|uniref:Uncharacterized protein n=1 Tax=Magnaporthiopsis poae (strain ATCC 64411 / 73-15) TaxID=644358 RepID=A0A0C4DK94_MAGP6|nr:hypothetical protein MAPG_00157 [Magnaporthiopsis poae ATCC 64411]
MRLRVVRALLGRWHSYLALPRQTPASWHQDRLKEELRELREARTLAEAISEASDVVFTISRAEHEGFGNDSISTSNFLGRLPTFWAAAVILYMLYKFTMRWSFYRVTAYACGLRGEQLDAVRDVINPAKLDKMDNVARRHGLEPSKFRRVGAVVRRVWPLLP